MYHGSDRLSREIHVGQGLEEDDFLSVQDSFGDNPFEFGVVPVLETPLFTEKLYEKKPDVVSGVRVFFSGIAKSNYKSHLY